MSNQEHSPRTSKEQFNAEHLLEEGETHSERLRDSRERAAEKAPERDHEASRLEALEHARSAERSNEQKLDSRKKSPEQRIQPSKRDKQIFYEKAMQEVRSEMSPASRAFSRLIHMPAVEKASEAAANTIARPNAILYGAIASFILTLGLYLIARTNGYTLSGTETIAAFVLGWIIGIAYDFLRTMITGKPS